MIFGLKLKKNALYINWIIYAKMTKTSILKIYKFNCSAKPFIYFLIFTTSCLAVANNVSGVPLALEWSTNKDWYATPSAWYRYASNSFANSVYSYSHNKQLIGLYSGNRTSD